MFILLLPEDGSNSDTDPKGRILDGPLLSGDGGIQVTGGVNSGVEV